VTAAGRRRGAALLALLGALATAPASPGPAAAADLGTLDARPVNVRVEGGGGWRADGEFSVLWDPAPVPGGDRSPTGVGYRIDAPTGKAVGFGFEPVSERELSIAIPKPAGSAAPGVYLLSVWLERTPLITSATATVSLRFDDEPPPPVRPHVPEEWIKAGTSVEVRIEHPTGPRPLSGIRGYAVALDHGSGAAPCAGTVCAADELDLDGGENDDSLVLGPLAEGPNVVRVVAVSGSGVPSATAGTAALHVDGTPPAVAIGGAPSGWSNQALTVTATAFDPLSGTADAGPGGPITAIAVDGGAPSVGRGSHAATTVHGDGPHLLTALARDAVGNLGAADPDAASRTVWIDETAPDVAFAAALDPEAPERIVALVEDALSGPSPHRGSIAIRPAGTSLPFEPLPTRLAGDRLLADWDSDAYPRGGYEFRAVAFDVAGNRTESSSRTDGAPMVLNNPVKAPASLAFGFGGRRFVAHRCRRRHGGLRCHSRTITAFSRRPALSRVAYGRRVPVAGRLTDAAGAPLAGLPVEVTETFAAGAEPATRATVARTGADGFFLARLAPGPSRRIDVRFAGTPRLAATDGRELRLGVRSALRLRASSASAAVGGAPVVFSGHLGRRGASLPAEGLRVALEFRVAGVPWSEFRTVQTDAYGAFRLAYAFSDDDSRGVRFQFRAHLAAQPGWPYDPAYSRPIAVTGR
jgi:hypothetical protein